MPWGDPAILRQILRESRFIADPKQRRKFQRTAVQTGLVESGGRNLPGGDADSQGWRQERPSVGYKNPRNVKASVRRFRQEFQSFNKPGLKSWQLAAMIQRPAAQYRGRYRDVRGEARKILQGAGGAGGGAPAGAEGIPGLPGMQGARNAPMGSEGLVSLLAALGQGKPQVQSAGVAPPEFSAQPVMPEGFQAASSGGGPAPKADIGALLEAVKTLGGDVARAPGQGPVAGQPGAEGAGAPRVRGATAEGLADWAAQWAQARGLPAGSRDRSRAENQRVGGSAGSMHLEDAGVGRGQEALDIPTTASQGGWDQYRKLVRDLGLKPNSGGFTTGTIKRGGKRFRVQVIFGDAHDHGDHIHVGFRRA